MRTEQKVKLETDYNPTRQCKDVLSLVSTYLLNMINLSLYQSFGRVEDLAGGFSEGGFIVHHSK